MLAKEITYLDFNDQERTETFYFNLSEAELAEMELSTLGGLEQKIRKMVSLKDNPEIFNMFKQIIMLSYGEKSPDGREFMKEDLDGHKLVRRFMQTNAYSELLMEIFDGGAESVANFINEILPKNVVQKIAEEEAKSGNIVDMPAAGALTTNK